MSRYRLYVRTARRLGWAVGGALLFWLGMVAGDANAHYEAVTAQVAAQKAELDTLRLLTHRIYWPRQEARANVRGLPSQN